MPDEYDILLCGYLLLGCSFTIGRNHEVDYCACPCFLLLNYLNGLKCVNGHIGFSAI
jgi:hypothetical protein